MTQIDWPTTQEPFEPLRNHAVPPKILGRPNKFPPAPAGATTGFHNDLGMKENWRTETALLHGDFFGVQDILKSKTGDLIGSLP